MRSRLVRHFTRCALAGIVALLPVGGLLLTVVGMEGLIADSWLAEQAWYVPGLGLVAVAVLIYAIGLGVSTLLGRWLLGRLDAALQALPALGRMYATLKQIVGYDDGKDAIFRRVVLIPSAHAGGEEYALVTGEHCEDGRQRLTVFVPGAPNPTAGRVVILDASLARAVDAPVASVLSHLIAVGAGDRPAAPERDAAHGDGQRPVGTTRS